MLNITSIREKLIKTTVRCHLTPTSVANIKKKQTITGSSLAVQWLGLSALTAMGLGSIPEVVGSVLVVTANRTNYLKYIGGH